MTSPAIVRQTQFLVALAEAGIEPDIQELLVAGNPSRGIAPGALAKALAALDATPDIEGAARYVLENSRRGNASLNDEQFDADTSALMTAYRDIIGKALTFLALPAAPLSRSVVK